MATSTRSPDSFGVTVTAIAPGPSGPGRRAAAIATTATPIRSAMTPSDFGRSKPPRPLQRASFAEQLFHPGKALARGLLGRPGAAPVRFERARAAVAVLLQRAELAGPVDDAASPSPSTPTSCRRRCARRPCSARGRCAPSGSPRSRRETAPRRGTARCPGSQVICERLAPESPPAAVPPRRRWRCCTRIRSRARASGRACPPSRPPRARPRRSPRGAASDPRAARSRRCGCDRC